MTMTVPEFLQEGSRWCDPAKKIEELGCIGWREYLKDPKKLETIEALAPWEDFCRLRLRLNGSALLGRWLNSQDPLIRRSAEDWLSEYWEACWNDLSDGKKRALALKENVLSRMRGKASVIDDISHALREAFESDRLQMPTSALSEREAAV